MAKNKPNGRKSNLRSFAGVPRIVMESPDYINLSTTAKVVLFELAYQYRGKNNGDLGAALGVLKKRGFKSKPTINRALKLLIEAKLIIRTRTGVFLNPGGRCALYALSWLPIDECFGKNLEIGPTTTPPRKFSIEK